MAKRYKRVGNGLGWKDGPSTNTLRNADNFNIMDKGINDLDNAIEGQQAQIDSLVAGGDSSPAAAQAQVGADGVTYGSLKTRLDTEHNSVKSELADIASYRKPVRFGRIVPPIDFISIDFELYRKLDGKIYHNIDLDARWRNNNIQQIIYTDIATGSNSTGNGSETTPYKTPAKAFQVAAASSNTNIKIIVNADLLLRQEMFLAFDTYFEFTNKHIVITTKDGKKIPFANGDSTVRQSKRIDNVDNGILPAWTLTSGNVYQTTRSNTGYVIDTSYRDYYNGNIKKMQKVASVIECEAMPGSYYINGSIIYTHTYDSRPSDGKLVCVFTWTLTNPLFRLYNSTLFMENFEFFSYDGVRIRGDATSHFIFNKFDFGQTGSINSLTEQLTGKIYLLECSGHDSYLDGFNYHYTVGANNRSYLVFEYNSPTYNCGNEPSGTGNNGTTAHEGASTIRVNCYGEGSQGVVCADVNGCYSLLYDCQMMDSKLAITDKRSASYQFSTDIGVNTAKAILVNCSGVSPRKSIISDSTAQITLETWNEDPGAIERTTTF
jgi:hypothetical protein